MRKTIITYMYLLLAIFLFSKQISYSLIVVDTLPPQINVFNNCGNYTVSVTETRDGSQNDIPQQKDVGVSFPPQLLTTNNRSFNFHPIKLHQNFVKGINNKEFSFSLDVIDKFKEAVAVFFVYDNSENQNIKYDSIRYKPKLIELSDLRVDFGNITVFDTVSITSQLKNLSDSEIIIRNISLKWGKFFKISKKINTPYLFSDTANLPISISYFPEIEISQNHSNDIDSLIIETECLRFAFPIIGKGVIPRIVVEDFDFGFIQTNTSKCYGDDATPELSRGIRIHNPGTGVLIIKGIYPFDNNSYFQLSNPFSPNLVDFALHPGGEIFLKSVCFNPKEAGEFLENLVVKNNSNGPDSTARLRGIAFDEGPYITSFDFGYSRVKSKKTASISIKNSSEIPIEITGIKIKHPTLDFRIASELMSNFPSEANPILIFPETAEDGLTEILVPIEFTPQAEYKKDAIVEVFFKDKSSYPDGKIFNYLYGFGIKSGIEANDYTFNPRVLINYEHSDTGKIIIKSTGITADLYIKNIIVKPVQPNSTNDFRFLSELPNDIYIKRGTSLEIPIRFRPLEVGERKIDLLIMSDAFEGDKQNSGLDTTVVSVAGNSYLKVLYAKNIDYGKNYHCSERTSFVQFFNNSNDEQARILDIQLVSGDVSAFRIEPNSYVAGIEKINPGGSINIPITFIPKDLVAGHFEAFVKLTADIDTCLAIVKAESFKLPITIKLDTVNDMIPGLLTRNKPPNFPYKDFPVYISSPNLNNHFINEYEVNLIYNRRDLMFAGIIDDGDVTKNWYFENYKEQDYDLNHKILTVKSKGLNRIVENGIIFRPVFKLLLGDTTFVNVQVGEINLFDEQNCAEILQIDGMINYSGCGLDIRNIMIAHTNYSFNIIQSNQDNIVLESGIGLEANTNISIYNSIGELIYIVTNSTHKEGVYQFNLPIENLSNGLYFAKMNSGPFCKSIKFAIQK